MHLLERDEPDPFRAQTIIAQYKRYKGTPYGVYLRKAFFALTGGYSVTTQMHMIEKDPEHEFLNDWIDIVDNPDLDPYIAHAIDTGTMVLDYLSKCDTEDAAKAFYMVLEWLTGYETIDEVMLMHLQSSNENSPLKCQ